MKHFIYNGEPTPYIVYKDGKVFSEKSRKFLTPWKNKAGYLYLNLFFRNISIRKSVHCIVAETFIPNPENKPQVNHKDGNKENNDVSNLEWVTQSENNLHAIKNNLRHPVSGSKVHFSKYTEDQVRMACKLIEENKTPLTMIEASTGIPVKTLGEIRNRKIWKEISKNYIFPDNFIISSKVMEYSIKVKVCKLLRQNIKTDEIISQLNLPKDSRTKSIIRDIKWNMDPKNNDIKRKRYIKRRHKLNLIKQSSTTIDQLTSVEKYPQVSQ